MEREKLFKILDQMAIEIMIAQAERSAGRYKDNIRQCPSWSEYKGMERTLKLLGIDVDYEFNDKYEITAVKACRIRIECK